MRKPLKHPVGVAVVYLLLLCIVCNLMSWVALGMDPRPSYIARLVAGLLMGIGLGEFYKGWRTRK